MAEQQTWQVIGVVDRMDMDKATPRYLMISLDGLQLCLARKDGETFFPVAGPYEHDMIRRCAENILAGNRRAVTWPEAQMALAIGCATFFTLAARNTRLDADASGAAPDAPEAAPPAPDCTPPARAVPPTQESLFACTTCEGASR